MSRLHITGPAWLIEHVARAASTTAFARPDSRAAVVVDLDTDLAVPMQTPLGEVCVGVSCEPALTVEANPVIARMMNAFAKADHMRALGKTTELRWTLAASRDVQLGTYGLLELKVLP